MLKYSSVSIYLNVTAKICDAWPSVNELKSRTFINFNILPVNSLRTSLTTFPKEENINSFPILLMINNSLSPAIFIRPNFTAHGIITAELFESGFLVFQLKIDVKSEISVREVNEIINNMISNRSICLGDILYNYIELAQYVLKLIKKELFTEHDEDIMLSEAYSIIRPSEFIPPMEASKIIGNEFERDFYEATIRRIPDMAEASIDIARNEQKNMSAYNNDLVYLNYHNFLVYVVPEKKHLPPELYIELVNQFKLYIANLYYMQGEVTANLAKLQEIPNRFNVLNKENAWLDSYRFKLLKSKEEFQSAIDTTAARVSWFNKTAYEKFEINAKETRLEHDFDQIEQVISRRFSLLREKHLQRISLILTIFSLLLAAVDILVGILLAG